MARQNQGIKSQRQHPGRTGFLDLPQELSDKIYRFCFFFEDIILYLPEPEIMYDLFHSGSSHVLRCCKQVQEEGLATLYGENIFSAYNVTSFQKFRTTVES